MTAPGAFFAVDRRAWGRVCDLGSLNAAVAYLVLASGTQADHRTTSWSVHAVEDYTGIPRHLAKTAIEKLIGAGMMAKTQGGTKPRYLLARYAEIPSSEVDRLTNAEAQVLAMVECQEGKPVWVPKTAAWDSEWECGTPFQVASRLADRGFLRFGGGQHFAGIMEPADDETDWIWLPRALVEGVDREVPPIELLRQTASLPAVRLFIDLYHAQSLPRNGGVHWRQLRKEFSRTKVGEYGAWVVSGFVPGTSRTWLEAPFVAPHVDRSNKDHPAQQFWDALRTIEGLGLATYVGHMIEADTDEASVVFPCAVEGGGEPEERGIAIAANDAGIAMLADWQMAWVDEHGAHLVPLRPHLKQAALVGLLRLRYQAATKANAEWSKLRPTWEKIARSYAECAEKPNDCQGLQYQM